MPRGLQPISVDEKRAYLRGYNRGRNRSGNFVLRILKIARGWRTQATRDVAVRRCDQCRFWRRSGDGVEWGFCGQDWESGAGDGYARSPARIISHENFSCINFLAKESA